VCGRTGIATCPLCNQPSWCSACRSRGVHGACAFVDDNDVLCPRDSAEQGSLADRLTQASPGLLVSRLGAQAGHYPARVRLLFDQNLSPRLLAILADLYGGSTHVRNEGLEAADDDTVWEYAARHGFAIVWKDADFHQRSFLLGAPPREVIWIQRSNCGTEEIAVLGAVGAPGVTGLASGDAR
jgi:predicted nuclease of predicted toxin-antitoxin system